MRNWISLFIILFSAVAFGEDKTTLYDFRYWSAPDHTRIVIDKEEDTLFNIQTSDTGAQSADESQPRDEQEPLAVLQGMR